MLGPRLAVYTKPTVKTAGSACMQEEPHHASHDDAPAGEARTEAMVRNAGSASDESHAYDSFADPAGLIMASIIEVHCAAAPNRAALLAAARELHMPNNPLVGMAFTPSVACPDSMPACMLRCACHLGLRGHRTLLGCAVLMPASVLCLVSPGCGDGGRPRMQHSRQNMWWLTWQAAVAPGQCGQIRLLWPPAGRPH
jgi:hypothetical protein